MGGEHRLDHAGREQSLHHIPIHSQTAVDLEHLMVDPHLRRLGDGVARTAQQVVGGVERATDVADADGAGEDDRHRDRGAPPLRQLLLHTDA